MGRNLPQKYNENLFHKIFNLLKRIWTGIKSPQNVEIKDKLFSNSNEEKRKVNEMEYLKFELDVNNTDFAKNEFIKILSDKPELLGNFSVDRLVRILEYYKKENEKKRELLKKLSV